MINRQVQQVFLGACPVIRPEGIYLDGHRVISLGLREQFGVGDVGDLLAYRAEWEPFIEGHLALWRHLNDLFESVPETQQCPSGIFEAGQIQNLSPTMRSFCASLALTRMYVSDTHPLGILTQWNAWKNKSSSEILAGATAMLEWHQDVVRTVGGPYKDELLKIAKIWNLEIKLPNVPEFTVQQEIIARIEGAYITVKGVIQIVGYGVGETLVMAGNVTQAVAEGLTATAKAIPETVSALPKAISSPWTWIGVSAVLVIAGGALLVYYLPRRENS